MIKIIKNNLEITLPDDFIASMIANNQLYPLGDDYTPKLQVVIKEEDSSIWVERANILRDKFKEYKNDGKGDLQTTVTKIKKWMLNNPTVSFDTIVEAVDYYLAEQSDNDPTYINKCPNFIYVDRGKPKVTQSKLSEYVEIVLNEE